MDTEQLDRMLIHPGFEPYVEGGARLFAAVFLAVVLILLLRARRRSSSDILLGSVFAVWLIVIVNNAFRYVLGFPPQYIHWTVYVLISVLEAAAIVQMIREARRVRSIQQRERVVGGREMTMTKRDVTMGRREDTVSEREQQVFTDRDSITDREDAVSVREDAATAREAQ